ncbi:hypothetical protein C4K27_3985 [Pseudomonas chlororaphis subsp. chlororaphis]|nr:hypothetical protein C4K27_3985 [Pseudomonas chlororaphis subsp. chlororaphis]
MNWSNNSKKAMAPYAEKLPSDDSHSCRHKKPGAAAGFSSIV